MKKETLRKQRIKQITKEDNIRAEISSFKAELMYCTSTAMYREYLETELKRPESNINEYMKELDLGGKKADLIREIEDLKAQLIG